METNALSPNVDRRISELLERERRRDSAKDKGRIAICISRRYGCEGYPLAQMLKARLDKLTPNVWSIFDKVLLDKISEDHGLSRQFLSSLDEYSSFTDKILAPLMKNWMTGNEAFALILRYILQIVEEGNAIIVGRGATLITQEKPGCFHFRLEAPLDYRITSIATRLGMERKDAEKLVLKNQDRRDRFISSYFGQDVSNVKLFHAVFNCHKMTTKEITESILSIVVPYL